MGINKTVTIITVGLVLVAGLLVWTMSKRPGLQNISTTNGVTIEASWELPEELEEISAIAFIDKDRVACIQDEQGSIFVYNLRSRALEDEFPFGGSGDYEGLALDGTTAYIAMSNGKLLEVKHYKNDPQVHEYTTVLTESHDVEGLFLDAPNNRLLMAVKQQDPFTKNAKGIYGFDLEQKKLVRSPAYALDFREKLFDQDRTKNVQDTFKPSEIALDNKHQVYLLEGETPKLLILDPSGTPKSLHHLDPESFPQPEGLAFAPDGALYISSEGKPARIHRISLK